MLHGSDILKFNYYFCNGVTVKTILGIRVVKINKNSRSSKNERNPKRQL
jgi:hypothetical protein